MILHFSVSEFISTYGKLNFLLINGIYLVVSSLVMQMRLIQIKVYYKLAAAKKYFLRVYIIDTILFDECCLLRVITGRHFFYTNLSSLSSLVQPPCY